MFINGGHTGKIYSKGNAKQSSFPRKGKVTKITKSDAIIYAIAVAKLAFPLIKSNSNYTAPILSKHE